MMEPVGNLSLLKLVQIINNIYRLTMKKIALLTSIMITTFSFGQSAMGIGLPDGMTHKPSVSIEFAAGNRGMVLPWVESKTGVIENGSILYDATDHKVKYLKGGSWVELSRNEIISIGATSLDTTGTTVDPITGIDGLISQNDPANPERDDSKTAIGTRTSVKGILVLEDANVAMILPKLASPHINIKNPATGMMAYDTLTKQLCIYNGKVWSFWK